MSTKLRAGDLRRAVEASLDALRERRAAIDSANVYPVPDADTGTNLVMTFEAVVEAVSRAGEGDADLAHAIRSGSLMGARGNSGVICAQILHAWADAVQDGPAGPEAVAAAFRRSVHLAYEAVLEPAEGTILTVARAASEAVQGAHAGVPDQFAAAARAAAEALSHTPEQLSVLADAGVVDAGGMGLVVVLQSFARALGADIEVSAIAESAAAAAGLDALCDGAAGGYAYEVQYVLHAGDDTVAPLRQLLGTIGDSVAVVGGSGTWRVHVHTDEHERAVGLGRAIGTLSGIEVVSFAEQARSTVSARGAVPGERGVPLARTDAPLTLIAHVTGSGVGALMQELGATTLDGSAGRPTPEQVAAAVEAAPAKHVVFLPNDDELFSSLAGLPERVSKDLTVLRTRDQAHGLAVAVAYGDARTAEDNVADLRAAADRIRTGGVALARVAIDTARGRAREGQAVGFADGSIVSVADDPVEAAAAVVEALLIPGASLVTVLAGVGALPGEPERLRDGLQRLRPGLTVEVHDGGQPAHRYLIAVE